MEKKYIDLGLQITNSILRKLRNDGDFRIMSWIYQTEYDRIFKVCFTDKTYALFTLGINYESVIEVSY